jgi:hypothetical protein
MSSIRSRDKQRLQRRRKKFADAGDWSGYKQFSKQLHTSYDSPARAAVLAYLESNDLYAVENDDRFGPDLVVYTGFRPKYYVEPEVKLSWQATHLGGQFPFATVQVPARKQKFLKLGLPVEFWILREDLQYALVIPDQVLAAAPQMEVPNKYRETGEFFYQVPVDQCILLDISAV